MGTHLKHAITTAAIGLSLAACGSTVPTSGGAPPTTGSSASTASATASATAVTTVPVAGPTGVVDQYWRSLEAGDCATAYGLAVDPAKTKFGSANNLCTSIHLDSVKSHTIDGVTGQTATSAMVRVTIIRGSGTRTPSTVVVVLVAAGWRISDFKA
jgi:hypothetical protein